MKMNIQLPFAIEVAPVLFNQKGEQLSPEKCVYNEIIQKVFRKIHANSKLYFPQILQNQPIHNIFLLNLSVKFILIEKCVFYLQPVQPQTSSQFICSNKLPPPPPSPRLLQISTTQITRFILSFFVLIFLARQFSQ